MKALVTGAAGKLGHDVVNELFRRGHEGIGSINAPEYNGALDGSPAQRLPHVRLDITDGEKVLRVLRDVRPDAVIHCAAWTAVDLAEDEGNRDRVFAVNARGTADIARACRELGCKMIYISTDHVFDGRGTEPWQPDCGELRPLGVYGRSKLEGELAVARTLDRYFIVRISWAFGLSGRNFVRTMLDAGRTHDAVRVVNDQIGTPTYTFDLARLLVDMAESDRYGYYHAANEGGYISRYDLACEIYRQAGLSTRVIPVTTAEYGLGRAVHPLNSRLDKSKLRQKGFEPLPVWQDALRRYLKEIRVL